MRSPRQVTTSGQNHRLAAAMPRIVTTVAIAANTSAIHAAALNAPANPSPLTLRSDMVASATHQAPNEAASSASTVRRGPSAITGATVPFVETTLFTTSAYISSNEAGLRACN